VHGWFMGGCFMHLAAVTLLCPAAFFGLLTSFFSVLLRVCVLQALQ
jgi:hypothetical protein